MENTEQKVIYDLGANKGQNLAYYLSKADKVVAVEANPILVDKLRQDFAKELQENRLSIVNECIVFDGEPAEVFFYRHKFDSVLSKFTLSASDNKSDFEKIKLRSVSIVELFEEYGSPYYIKIDLEGLDFHILKEIINAGIVPSFLSVEMSTAHDFSSLLSDSLFQSFNLVAGYNVKSKYQFPEHSAGPFGNDIRSPWLSRSEAIELYHGLGNKWCDLHCSFKNLRAEHDVSDAQRQAYYEDERPALSLRKIASTFLPSSIKKILKKHVFKQ